MARSNITTNITLRSTSDKTISNLTARLNFPNNLLFIIVDIQFRYHNSAFLINQKFSKSSQFREKSGKTEKKYMGNKNWSKILSGTGSFYRQLPIGGREMCLHARQRGARKCGLETADLPFLKHGNFTGDFCIFTTYNIYLLSNSVFDIF